MEQFTPLLFCEFAESGLEIEKFLANVAGQDFDPAGTEFAIIAKTDIS
jgi:hypothetical protein